MRNRPPAQILLGTLALLAALSAGGGGSLVVVERLESRNAFCNACHLPGGKPLHADKMRIARTAAAPDLTARHFQRTPSEFLCADCHRGHDWRERTQVLWGSFVNAVRYVAADYGEPEALRRPLPNGACTGCHDMEPRTVPTGFHGTNAHRSQSGIRCVECHLGHAQADDPDGHVAAVLDATREVCGRCHRGRPFVPPVEAVLASYRGVLKSR